MFPSPIGELHFSILLRQAIDEALNEFPSPIGELHFSIIVSFDDVRGVRLNADIRGMVQAIKDFKTRRKSAIEANDYETAEQMWHDEKVMTQNLAEANYQKIRLYYSKADAIYEDKIIAICSLPGLIGMKEAKLIECCANINGRKLYAI